MNEQQTPDFSSLFFHLSHTDYITDATHLDWYPITSLQHTLIVFMNTEAGTISIDDKPYFVSYGKALLLKPQTIVELTNMDNNLCFYKLTFTAIHVGQQTPTYYVEQLFHNQIEFAVYPFSRFNRLIEELYELQNKKTDRYHLKKQSLFQELLSILFEHQQLEIPNTVEQTIKYIHQNYHQQLTVKQLAKFAHVAQWQYSSIFQTITGQKPLDYLTELRINHAKDLLQQTEKPLKDIAHHVGFNDEYYFNRRFKQLVGIPPKQFGRMRKHKIRVKDWTGHEVEIPSYPSRVIYHGETFGDLLVFNVQPIGGDKTNIDKSFYKNFVPYVQDVAFPIDIEKSSKLKPDLIIFTSSDEQQYNKIAKIAPTVTHNSWDSLENRISTLGMWLGQKREAENWLNYFKNKEKIMWKQLQSIVKPGETASVFIFDRGNRLFVMGNTGLATALYHPHGFQPVDLIQKIMDEDQGYKEIQVELLNDYAGDRIFMLVSENPTSKLALEELMQSLLWNSLPAVKNGHVYLVDAAKWNFGDAFTREKLLRALPRILGYIS